MSSCKGLSLLAYLPSKGDKAVTEKVFITPILGVAKPLGLSQALC